MCGTGAAPFFLYIGWTLPHGPDAEKSMRSRKYTDL